MNQRQKVLLVILIGVVLLWQGGSIVGDMVTQRKGRLKSIESIVEKKRDRKRDALAAMRDMKRWKEHSLPPDPLIASTLYHNWLIELVSRTGLSRANVSPGQVVPKGPYHTIPMTIRTQTTIDHLCKFLYEFYRSDIMHRVVRMTLESERRGEEDLKVTLEIEGLSLIAGIPRQTLFIEGEEPGISPSMQDRTRDAYALLEDKNLFVRTYNGPPRPAPKPVAPPPQVARPEPKPEPPKETFDVAQFVYLIASLANGTNRDAWLYDRTSNQRVVLTEGSRFDVGGVSGTVVRIEIDAVTLRVDNEEYLLEVGQNLRQMRKLPVRSAAARE